MVYSSNRAFLLIAFGFIFLAMVAWDRDWGGIDAIISVLSQLANTAGLSWTATFLERLSSDFMTLGMVITLCVITFYGLVQYIGALSDGREVSDFRNAKKRKRWRLGPRRMLLWFSGRPESSDGTFFRDEQGSEIHFGYGRHTLLAPLRLALWAFPVVGFLGTVIGISGAVARLPQVLEDTQQLNLLLSSLHTAFDTTFVGLAASLVIMALLHIIESVWDRNELIASTAPANMGADSQSGE